MPPLGAPERDLKRNAPLLLTVCRLPWAPPSLPCPGSFLFCAWSVPPLHPDSRVACVGKGSLPQRSTVSPTLSCLPVAEVCVPGSLLASVQVGMCWGRGGRLSVCRHQPPSSGRRQGGAACPMDGSPAAPWAPLQAWPWGSPALVNCGHFSPSLLQKRQSWAAGGTGRVAVTQTLTR